MFKPSDMARVFGVPIGADFPAALVDGLLVRTQHLPPEILVQTEIFVNTRRMQRRVTELFSKGSARLLPQIRLVTDLANDPIGSEIPPPGSQLRRQLELSKLISALLDKEPDLAPRSALFDLSASLALLLDEMHDEGVIFDDIQNIDVSDHSDHWERSQKFLKIVDTFTSLMASDSPDISARQRFVIERLEHNWVTNPPKHPVIVAGSTGSRGSTSLLMAAVSKLPQGALVLPGFDFDLPSHVWDVLNNPHTAEVHPQYRFRTLLKRINVKPADVQPWHVSSAPPVPSRNKLLSLALRPAPITDQWMQDGPQLSDIQMATDGMTLIESASGRQEAMAIALILRKAAEENQTAALVTPDKTLSRRVFAALDRWRIEPDMSAGDALETTVLARLFRHVMDLFGTQLTAEALLILIKHPLVCAARQTRPQHLIWTRQLETTVRKDGVPFLTAEYLFNWAENSGEPGRLAWVAWLTKIAFNLPDFDKKPLGDILTLHRDLVDALISGPARDDCADIWTTASGQELTQILRELHENAPYSESITAQEYRDLFFGLLQQIDVRDPVRPHPKIMIWGTLEARVQGADLVILGGLNEGTWPQTPAPDPWLNRNMRLNAGLRLPERKIGLSAHDFQQAIAAKTVVLTRSIRDDEAPSIPSRWVSRLVNLLDGLSDESRSALKAMRQRGSDWLELVRSFETPEPIPPEPRPSPSPPLASRPRSLSVTAITRLIRDPYAVYAREVLKLNPLNPLKYQPDARLRGTILHRIMEEFIRKSDFFTTENPSRDDLLNTADHILEDQVPWPTTRLIWRQKLARIADVFLEGEKQRLAKGRPKILEGRASFRFESVNFTLTAVADRIDLTENGTAIIYDYKTGKIPTKKEMDHFEKQLLLEAVLTEVGGFSDLSPISVQEVAHIGLGSTPTFSPIPLNPDEIKKIQGEFVHLISSFDTLIQGYSARRAVAKLKFSGDFDHLARYGEWDDSCDPTWIEVGS